MITCCRNRKNISLNHGMNHFVDKEDLYLGFPLFRKFNKTNENWTCYVKELEQYFVRNGLINGHWAEKRVHLWKCIESDAVDHILKLTKGQFLELSYNDMITSLNDHYAKTQPILEAHLKFYETKMKEHQTYSEWAAELRKAAEKCLFQCPNVECTASYVDQKIRDMIVLHAPHDSVRTAALEKSNPSLEDVLQLAAVIMSRETSGSGDGAEYSALVDTTYSEDRSTAQSSRLAAVTMSREANGGGGGAEYRALVDTTFSEDRSTAQLKIYSRTILHYIHTMQSLCTAALEKSNPTLEDVQQLAPVSMSRETNVGGGEADYSALVDTTSSQVEEIQNTRTRLQMKTAIVFLVGYSADRVGLHDDVGNIFQTFKCIFNAEVQDWTNLNKDKLKQKFKELTKDEWRHRFKKVDFVTVFCMAHGLEEGQVLFGNKMHDLKGLLLTPLFRIKELDKKLKWLVVQTCRGQFNDPFRMERDVVVDYYPDYYYISYCTGEGTVSCQLIVVDEPGKIFIRSICQQLRENAEKLSIHQILTNVNALVKQHGKSQKFKQISASESISNYPEEFYFHKRPQHYVKITI